MKKEEYLKYNLPTKEAEDFVKHLFDRNQELEDIFAALQPLLFALSIKMYGEDDKPISLDQLVKDAVKFIGEYDEQERTTSTTSSPTLH